MFTPSLLAMMVQGLVSEIGEAREPRTVEVGRIHEFLADLVKHWYKVRSKTCPSIPVLGRTDYALKLDTDLCDLLEFRDSPSTPYHYFYGRVPVDVLVRRISQTNDVGADREIFDLGTPLREAHAGSSPSAVCDTLFPNTARSPRVRVAVIDRGDFDLNASPSDYKGKLTHAITTDVVMSSHAENVLCALLERLDHHRILSECQFYCALVAPAKRTGVATAASTQVGSRCFEHANSVDLLKAIQALDNLLGKGGLPVVLNLSMGTHVGPHNGESPLEDFIRNTWTAQDERYLHVAAGNDGGRGIAGRFNFVKDVEETLRIRTGPAGGNDLLLELWWSDTTHGGAPDVNVDIFDGNGTPLGLQCFLSGGWSSSVMAHVPSNFMGIACQSLFHAHAWASMQCIAFALNATDLANMQNLDIVLTVKMPVDAVVYAWIVIADDPRSCFLEGGSAGTVCVPATESESLSVTGIDRSGQPWSASSRGPAPNYASSTVGQSFSVPLVAHSVDLGFGNEKGTSYASPKACADTAVLVRDAAVRSRCNTASDVAKELVGKFGSPTGPFQPGWNDRIGFGSLK